MPQVSWPSRFSNCHVVAVLSKDEWVRGSFVRDQDVTVDMGVMTDVFHRILSLNGSAEAFVNATAARPDFAVLRQ